MQRLQLRANKKQSRISPQTSKSSTAEEGSVMIWAIIGLIVVFVVILGIIALARLHLLRAELTNIADTAAVSAASHIDKNSYFTAGLSCCDTALKLDNNRAKITIENAVTAAVASRSSSVAQLSNVHLTGFSIGANNVLQLRVQADAQVFNIVPGYASISTPVIANSYAQLTTADH